MTERTYNIIMACKAKEYCNISDAVKEYMAKECASSVDDYHETALAGIMQEVMYDYIDTCDKPSSFLRDLNNIINGELLSVGERIARAFVLVRVKNRDGQYVNGFGEWAKKEEK